MLSFFEFMTPKLLFSREIVEEAMQTTHIHLDKAINQTQQQMGERFDKTNVDLEHIQIRIDNVKQAYDLYMKTSRIYSPN